MELSGQKSQCSFTNTHEAIWRPISYLSRQQIKYKTNPKFLRITYDRQLSLGLNAPIFGSKMKQQAGALRCLASTDWGYEKSMSRSTCIAKGRSTAEDTAAAWLPLVSITTTEKLEMCQWYAGKVITGQIKTTHVKAILA